MSKSRRSWYKRRRDREAAAWHARKLAARDAGSRYDDHDGVRVVTAWDGSPVLLGHVGDHGSRRRGWVKRAVDFVRRAVPRAVPLGLAFLNENPMGRYLSTVLVPVVRKGVKIGDVRVCWYCRTGEVVRERDWTTTTCRRCPRTASRSPLDQIAAEISG